MNSNNPEIDDVANIEELVAVVKGAAKEASGGKRGRSTSSTKKKSPSQWGHVQYAQDNLGRFFQNQNDASGSSSVYKRDVEFIPKGEHKPRSRSKGSPRQPRMSIEVFGRKLAPPEFDQSPYACKIIQLPSAQPAKKAKKKLYVNPRDQKLILDELKDHKAPKPAGPEEPKIIRWLQANPMACNLNSSRTCMVPRRPPSSPPLLTGGIPLKSWPNYENLIKAVETQTACDALDFSVEKLYDQTPSTASTSTDVETEACGSSCEFREPLPKETSTSSLHRSMHMDEFCETETDSTGMSTVEKLAEKMEVGIFSTSEACNVLINTMFKSSLNQPEAMEAVVNSKGFQEFLRSHTEIEALENSAQILESTATWITEYLNHLPKSRMSVEDEFAERSSEIMKSSESRKNVIGQKDKFEIWSFVPPSNSEKFQLSLFLNTTSKELVQTIECQDHIFHTRYATQSEDPRVIRKVSSATREQVGLPAVVQPSSILDTIVKCSSYATGKLSRAKTLTAKCNKKLSKLTQQITKPKYTVSKSEKLDKLEQELKQINVCTGIIYQISKELGDACEDIQSGMWNSSYVQEVLRFPRISAYSDLNKDKEHSELSSVEQSQSQSVNDSDCPENNKMAIKDAMIKLSRGLKSIDFSISMGQFALGSVKMKHGVKLNNKYKTMIKQLSKGVNCLGSEKDIDYGCLLMTLLCSTEMVNHFEGDLKPSADKFVKASILTHLGKLNWETGDLLGICNRMEKDAWLMTVKSTSKLREIRKRKGKLENKK